MNRASPAESSQSRSTVRLDARTRTGCRTCRTRKIKCDETHPTCHNCKRTAARCEWASTSSGRSASPPTPALRRSRARLACEQCRAKKIRCSGPQSDDGACERCEKAGESRRCQWKPAGPAPAEKTHVISPSATSALLDNKAALESLMGVYFATVHHYGFLTFLPQPQFFRMFERGQAPRELTMLMAANALRFGKATQESELETSDLWADEAMHTLLPMIHQGVGAVHLMSVILAQRYESARGRHTSSFMLTGYATRIALFLSLHTSDETFPPESLTRLTPMLQRETLRRLCWAVFFSDTIADGGRYDIATMSESTIRNQLPCDEASFSRGIDVVTEPLYPSLAPELDVQVPTNTTNPHMSISAHLIRTAAIRRRILHFAWSLKDRPRSLAEAQAELHALSNILSAVIDSLPPRLAYHSSQLFVLTDRLPAFILLHTLRHNCYVILERAKLLVYSQDPSMQGLMPQCRKNRIARALPTAGIVADALKRRVNFDPHVAVQAYVALEILLLEPRRLAQSDPAFRPDAPELLAALVPLLTILRHQAFVSKHVSHLHVEASYRLVRCGLSDLLDTDDWAAFRSEYYTAGEDEAEYDFRSIRVTRGDYSKRAGVVPAAVAAELILNQGCPTATASLGNSPVLDAADVGSAIAPSGTALPPLEYLDSAPASFPWSRGPDSHNQSQSQSQSQTQTQELDFALLEGLFDSADPLGFSGPAEVPQSLEAEATDPWAWLT